MSMKFNNNNNMNCGWKVSGKNYQPYYYDGFEYKEMTLEHFNELPNEVCNKKEGVFIKGNTDLTSWTQRYFLVRGGMMTYFVNNRKKTPQGTIPLKNCYIEVPNEEGDANQFELRILHPQRRQYVFKFPNRITRDEWKTYLTNYIAKSFVSKKYRLAEAIEHVVKGDCMNKYVGVVGIGEELESYHDNCEIIFYIDWYSSNPSQWCLRYSTRKLKLIPSTLDRPCEYELEQSFSSDALQLEYITKVSLDDSSGHKSIKLHIYNDSKTHPNGVGEVWKLIPKQESRAALWVYAIQSVLELQDINNPTQTHRRSRHSIENILNKLNANDGPTNYTRVTYFEEVYAINHGNRNDNSYTSDQIETLLQEMSTFDDNDGDDNDVDEKL